MSEGHKEHMAEQADVYSFYKRAFGKLVPGDDWIPYRGTTWFEPEPCDSLISFADAEAESMAYAKRRGLQTSIDVSSGVSVEFKGDENGRAKALYDQLVKKLFELKMKGIDTSGIVSELQPVNTLEGQREAMAFKTLRHAFSDVEGGMDLVLEHIGDSFRIGMTNRGGDLNSGTRLSVSQNKAVDLYDEVAAALDKGMRWSEAQGRIRDYAEKENH